jgi:hypothetical protein
MVMKGLIKNFLRFLGKIWPFAIILAAVGIFFYPVWLKGLVPIPGDFIVGTYFPWLSYKWGYEVGVPVKNPITSDVVSVIYPIRSFGIDLMKNGNFPLWISNMFVGYPLLANFQAALLSPTIFLYFLLPKLSAWTLQVILQPLLACLFMYLLLREFKLGKIASVVGGIIYGFSGFNTIWLEWNAHSLVAAWIPLIFLLTKKFLVTLRTRWGVALSITVALQILSGYPQIVLYTLGALGLFVLFRKEKTNVSFLIKLGLFILLGLALSSIQLIPALELFANSQRTREIIDLTFRYLPWQNLINFFAPDFFGNPATGNYWGVGNYTFNIGYSGIVAIFLAIVGTVKYLKDRTIKFFVSLFFLSLAISLPNPISKLLAENRTLGIAALSLTKILVLANFSLAALAAYGLDKIKQKKEKMDIRALYFPFAVLGGTLIASFISLKLISADYIFSGYLRVGVRNLVLPMILTILLFGIFIVRHKFYSEKLNKFTVLAIAFLVAAELFRFGWKYTPFSPTELVFPETPITSFLKKQPKPFRISGGDVMPMNMWVPYNLESASGYDAVYPKRWAKLTSGIKTGSALSEPSGRYADFDSYDSPWVNLLNIKYILALKTDELAKPDASGQISYKFRKDNFKMVFEDKEVAVLENTKAFPRAFFVTQWESLTEGKDLEALLDKNFPFDKKIVLQEKFNKFSQTERVSSKVDYISYGANSRQINVESDKDGFLFVSEILYPGWKALVDGSEEKIYLANYAFMAVPVRSGEHKVEFIYEPESFKIGKWISGSTLFVLLAILINGQYKKIGSRTSRTSSS